MDDEAFGNTGAISARVESSYLINLRDLDVKHVKDFVFVHGECILKIPWFSIILILLYSYSRLIFFKLLLYCLDSLCPIAF